MTENRTTTEYVAMFDAVVEQIFNVLHKGVDIPPFMDFANTQKASNIALEMHRQGCLKAYYERVKRGAV
nr:MAG TPA: hypothetical protein [Caudoviricetes sp.]